VLEIVVMRLRAPVAWALCLGVLVAGLLADTASASDPEPSPRIIGGSLVADQATAPWSVLITHGGLLCSGSIIDAAHVITAAHCTQVGGEPAPVASYTVRAGLSSYAGDVDPAAAQARGVAAVRVHPSWGSPRFTGDVAILTLSNPFSITAAVSPVAVAQTAPATGSAVRVVGFGQFDPDMLDFRERVLETRIWPDIGCYAGIPAVLCIQTASGAVCPGDSGSGVVTQTTPPTLVAVVDISVEGVCAVSTRGGVANLTSPEISAWLAGSATPPLGPRGVSAPTLSGQPYVGATLSCSAAQWSGEPSVTTSFIDLATFATLQSGAATTYKIPPTDLGRDVACVSVATNAGGTTQWATETIRVLPPLDPMLTFAIDAGGRMTISLRAAADALLRLTFFASDGRVAHEQSFARSSPPLVVPRLKPGKYRACVTFPETGIYQSAVQCVAWTQNGSAAKLIEVTQRSRASGRRVRVTLRTPRGFGLRERRLQAVWILSRCAGCPGRSVRRMVRLHATNTLRSPVLARGRRVRLEMTVPAVSKDGVRYARDRLTVSFPLSLLRRR
jgi:hypothetical protein